MTPSRTTLVLITFLTFIILRIVAWSWPFTTFGIYGDAYQYYVPAGISYVRGALPDAINAEHPPLAKYIIGFFALYFGEPNIGSMTFGFLSAVVAFALAKRLTGKVDWALASVWILAFDQVNILSSVHPMLEIFMLFFSLLGIYFLVAPRGKLGYGLTGIMFGLALACKWTGFAFLVAGLLFVILNKKYLDGLFVSICAIGAYVLSYAPLIAAKGFGAFINLQFWMGNFMLGAHPYPGSLQLRLLSWFLFRTTTFATVLGYDPGLHPEAFRILEANFISFAHEINPLVTLLLFPLLYWQLRQYWLKRNQTSQLTLLMLLFVAAVEFLFVRTEPWLYLPLNALIAVLIPGMFSHFEEKSGRSRALIFIYLALVAAWPIVTGIVTAMRFTQ